MDYKVKQSKSLPSRQENMLFDACGIPADKKLTV
jgi:hypothetical protein